MHRLKTATAFLFLALFLLVACSGEERGVTRGSQSIAPEDPLSEAISSQSSNPSLIQDPKSSIEEEVNEDVSSEKESEKERILEKLSSSVSIPDIPHTARQKVSPWAPDQKR